LLSELETILDTGVNSTTEDGVFSIEAVRCVGCCGLSPVLMLDQEVYGKVKKDQLAEILAKYREK
jgi:NADH-quinone oxidoreductase subunit E